MNVCVGKFWPFVKLIHVINAHECTTRLITIINEGDRTRAHGSVDDFIWICVCVCVNIAVAWWRHSTDITIFHLCLFSLGRDDDGGNLILPHYILFKSLTDSRGTAIDQDPNIIKVSVLNHIVRGRNSSSLLSGLNDKVTASSNLRRQIALKLKWVFPVLPTGWVPHNSLNSPRSRRVCENAFSHVIRPLENWWK